MDVIIDESKKLDMKIWILDDSHFPTGYANGAAMKADDSLRRQSIYSHVYEIRQGQKQLKLDLNKVMKKIPSTLMSRFISKSDKDAKHVFTDDMLISVTALVDGEKMPLVLLDGDELSDNKIKLSLPEGTKKVYVTFLTRNAGIHKSYINMMNEKSCRLLIDAVYEPHFEHYKEEFGKTILGFFSDEPELGNGVYFNNSVKVGEDFDFPWSAALEENLKDKFGNDFAALMPLLWDEADNKELASMVRYEYMNAVTRLVEKCFSKQIGFWCNEHGVQYIGHIIEDGNAHARTANSLGHYFRGLSGQHMAGIDDIGGQVLPFREDAPAEGVFKMIGGRDGEFYHFLLGKLASSMAYIQSEKNGKAMCEIFGNYGWGEGPRMEKYLADHFMVQGINHYVPHAFSPKPYPDKDCPPHFYANGHNPQYRAFSEVIRYMNRICELISDGRPVLETAVLYHGEGEWAGEAMLSQKPARELMESQIDFHIIPCDVFEERDRYNTCLGDRFSVNGNVYKKLFIPYTQFIRTELADALTELKDAGCEVIFIDNYPEGLVGGESLPDTVRRCRLAKSGSIAEYCNIDVEIIPSNKRIRTLHYKKEDCEFYYIVNEDDSLFDGKIRIPKCEKLTGYDAWSDRLIKLNCDTDDKGMSVELILRPSDSMIIFINDAGVTEKESLLGLSQRMERLLNLNEDLLISTCKAVDYPEFSEKKKIKRAEDYARTDKKFSGFIAYDKTFNISKGNPSELILLNISNAGEDVEVFINGRSLGIQVLPPFIYDITEYVVEGENQLRIEVATTLERERGANKKKQAPTGITGEITLGRLQVR